MWSHGFTRRASGLKGRLRRLFYRLPHAMLLYGNRARNMMIDMGFDPRRLYVVFNSLDYDKQLALRNSLTQSDIDKARAKLFVRPKLPILLFIGRLTPQKKLTMLVDAINLLANDSHPYPVNLLLVGDGPERNNLESAFKMVGLMEYVNLYGACHNEEELAPLITAADLCVAPGEVGLTAMHALTYGTPIVTHDDPSCQMPEYEAITPGKTGEFFQRGNAIDLARVIRNWLTQKTDRQLTREECYEVIDNYYNPKVQMQVLNSAVMCNKDADELLLEQSEYVSKAAEDA